MPYVYFAVNCCTVQVWIDWELLVEWPSSLIFWANRYFPIHSEPLLHWCKECHFRIQILIQFRFGSCKEIKERSFKGLHLHERKGNEIGWSRGRGTFGLNLYQHCWNNFQSKITICGRKKLDIFVLNAHFFSYTVFVNQSAISCGFAWNKSN